MCNYHSSTNIIKVRQQNQYLIYITNWKHIQRTMMPHLRISTRITDICTERYLYGYLSVLSIVLLAMKETKQLQ